ncbi:MAG: CPBP family intramembrane metalloprotease [Armatimonadetes bacterium]|nr:CPBP family intramembrane metalloprotease [Armatimonadota bacterium]
MDVTPPPVLVPPVEPQPPVKPIHPFWSASGTSVVLLVIVLVVSNIVAVPVLVVAFARMMQAETFPGFSETYTFRAQDTARAAELQKQVQTRFPDRKVKVEVTPSGYAMTLSTFPAIEESIVRGNLESAIGASQIVPQTGLALKPSDPDLEMKEVVKDPIVLVGSAGSLQIAILILYFLARKVYFKAGRSLPPLHSGRIAVALLVGVLVGPLCWIAADLIEALVRQGMAIPDDSIWAAVAHYPMWGKVGIVLTGVIGAPICEEIFFRGMLIGVFQKYGIPWAGVVFSAVTFGLAHLQSVAVVASITGMGLVLGFVYVKTKSIYSTIAIHMVNNALSFAILLGFVPWPGR